MNTRPIFYIIGIFVSTLAFSMMLPMLVDIYFHDPDWKVFFFCILATAFFGGTMVMTNSSPEKVQLNVRQAFLLTALSWVALAGFAALPFWMSQPDMNFTNSFFEAMSGITTTGSTVMRGLDTVPPGILIWRAILQWLGGIGIIVMALSVMPFLKVGGMQLFRAESSESEKVIPRAASMAGSIGVIYFALTMVCMFSYYATGLSLFDAAAHAMTTIATGGFSTSDNSFGKFDHAGPEIIAIIFMILGALPFALYVKAVRGTPETLFRDSQVRWFLAVIAGSTLLMVGYLCLYHGLDFWGALRRAAFNVVSMITGTGYYTADYKLWAGFAASFLFFLMMVGGCAGSTTCGIKIFRFQILYAVIKAQMKRLLHPHGVFIPHYGGRPIPEGVPVSVMGFFFVYALCFCVLTIALSMTGIDFTTAISGAATSISNVGPGVGDIIGPHGNFSSLPGTAKWILCGGMLLGRLELFTVLVLFSPTFWRR